MERFFKIVGDRIMKHWLTTLKGIVYAVILFMYYEGKITTQDWILATGSILVINSIFIQKDPGKTANKVEDPTIP